MKKLMLLIVIHYASHLSAKSQPMSADDCRKGKLEVLQALIAKDKDINRTLTQDNKTCLHLAAEHSRIDIVNYLISMQANTNSQDANGNTPLHYAIFTHQNQLTELLLDSGADITLTNKNGQNAAKLATTNANLLLIFKTRGITPETGTWPVILYGLYTLISIGMTIWVARTLFKNGQIFLVDAFSGNEKLATSINHLLVVGFYLINIGYICVALSTDDKPFNIVKTIEKLSVKVGVVLLILGIMHLFNLLVFSKFRKNALKRTGHAVS